MSPPIDVIKSISYCVVVVEFRLIKEIIMVA